MSCQPIVTLEYPKMASRRVGLLVLGWTKINIVFGATKTEEFSMCINLIVVNRLSFLIGLCKFTGQIA